MWWAVDTSLISLTRTGNQNLAVESFSNFQNSNDVEWVRVGNRRARERERERFQTDFLFRICLFLLLSARNSNQLRGDLKWKQRRNAFSFLVHTSQHLSIIFIWIIPPWDTSFFFALFVGSCQKLLSHQFRTGKDLTKLRLSTLISVTVINGLLELRWTNWK